MADKFDFWLRMMNESVSLYRAAMKLHKEKTGEDLKPAKYVNIMDKKLRILSSDEEYVALRDERNALRDDPENLNVRGCYMAAKALDPILELYERSKGTEYCQSVYLKLSQYGR